MTLKPNKRRLPRRQQGAIVTAAQPTSPLRIEWIVLFATALLLSLTTLLAFSGSALAQQGANQRPVAVAQVVTDSMDMTKRKRCRS